MRNWKNLALGGALLLSTQTLSYDVVDRYKLLEDKFKTEEMLRPYGHDFLFDISAYANKNLLDLVDDVDSVDDAGDTNAQLNEANRVLEKYDKSEQTLRLNAQFGIPLFTFHAFGAKIVPDLRFGAQFGANIGIRSDELSRQLLVDLFDLSPEIEEKILQMDDTQFTKLKNGTYTDVEDLLLDLGVDAQIAAEFDGDQVPGSGTSSVPNLAVFTKLDVKAGLLFNVFKNEWFGHWNLYGLHRTDFFRRLDAKTIVNGDDVLGGQDELNSQVFLATDLMVGKSFLETYRAYLAIEEIEIARLSDNVDKAGELTYELDPLIRLHADARFSWKGLSLMPFLGVHKRSGYGFADGLYAGTDLGAHVWGDRLGVTFRTILDNEHITLSPQLKLWFMQFQYSLKQPISSTVDDVKTSTMHSVNVRFFF